ncbi:MAG: phosphoribosylformylglycinamidine synthase [Clostridiaceae bacterium]|nr:phosphoribosylformylglycinamidine synthase [Clostridiaceae bacterium]
MVRRLYVEKRSGLDGEAKALLADLRTVVGIENLTGLRLLCRYDTEGLDDELFDRCRTKVFSEPQLDLTYATLPESKYTFAVEYLPGQFDQRADSAAQCIQLLAQCERPTVRSAKVYLPEGPLTEDDLCQIKKYVINPVEAREASLALPETLAQVYPAPPQVAVLQGFRDMTDDAAFIREYGLAMDEADLRFCRSYFEEEGRDPTMTELRLIDTYWSDHCRHTTFRTEIDKAEFADPMLEETYRDYLATRAALGIQKPVCLMDLATVAVKWLKAGGGLQGLDESEEINACTVKVEVETEGGHEPWLLLFKNETHNHPTEIEPFGGAATCIGGAIRDPLSGRAYVYAAMRLTGAADPLTPISETLPGKLPQRKICTSAAAGYSSYGNQIGLCTGIVDELYHPGYAAKRMEVGAVIAAAPQKNVRRETPAPGDVVILLGGRTGRDGCGGATGSSKSHTLGSLEACGAEVQKGNAPEERKLQRLFRDREAAKLIKRCNDFGAGGVSVAIGELAEGLDIDLSAVPKKYEGLDGTELAISESQERMAVVVAEADARQFLALAHGENLEATVVAYVKAEERMTMRWNGDVIVDLSREFLDSNGAEKHITVSAAAGKIYENDLSGGFADKLKALCGNLSFCSRQGLSERFDSTVGAGTVLMPFGGKHQRTPIQTMAHKLSREHGDTGTCSLMSWGFDPYVSENSPFHGAYLAVAESVAKLAAAGGGLKNCYLSFQEYFEKPGRDPARWGKPFAALLGAYKAQKALGLAAIGGKDSMSGTFEQLDVPPTLISFAVTTADIGEIVSPEFKAAGHKAALLVPECGEDGLPSGEALLHTFAQVRSLLHTGKACAAYVAGRGGVAEAVTKMCFGNGLGFRFDPARSRRELFGYLPCAFVLELTDDEPVGLPLGEVTETAELCGDGETIALDELLAAYERRLEPVYPQKAEAPASPIPRLDFSAKAYPAPAVCTAHARVLIPVFPGTNCEYDSAKAAEAAGLEAQIFVIRNRTAEDIRASVNDFAAALRRSQAVFIPGGFSGGDEPDGSAKFITSFFRNGAVSDGVSDLLDARGGLMCGVCNGFQALIKLGLIPFGKIIDTDEHCPTLTYNVIGRHQSRLVRTRVASNKSPWLRETKPGDVFTVPVSHGEGRFLCEGALLQTLAENGQIATQYADFSGVPTLDIRYNPNGSAGAVEGITSPDGRVFGKMSHSERIGDGLYKNVPGNYDIGLFRSAVRYFKGE